MEWLSKVHIPYLLKRVRRVVCWQLSLILVISILVVIPLRTAHAAPFNGLTNLPTAWTNFVWQTYLFNGSPVYDAETSSDPSNGGAAVQPSTVDIASGAAGAGPGTQPSVLFAYYDGGTPGNVNYTDDFYGFRLRLNADPQHGTGYVTGKWDVLIDIDGDGFKEFIIQLDGDWSSNSPDRLRVFYSDLPQEIFNPATDEVAFFVAGNNNDPQTYNHTRVVTPTGGDAGLDSAERWLDFQVPITAFKNGAGVQQIYPSSLIRLFYSTSASNTDPLQKDWMLTPFSFGDPVSPNIEATKTDSLVIDADGNGVPSAGDTIQYTVAITNSGSLDASGVTFSDTPDANSTLVVGSVTTSQGTVTSGNTPGDTTVGVNVGTVTRGSALTVAITFRVTNTPFPGGVTQISNQGTVSGNNFTTEPTDDPKTTGTDDDPTVTTVGAVSTSADLAITKTDSPDPVTAGGTLTYTLTVTNNGPSTADSVTVTETYPAGFTYGTANPLPTSGNNQWTFGSIAASADQTITITGNVTATSGSLTNMANVTSSTYDLSPANNTVTADTTVSAGGGGGGPPPKGKGGLAPGAKLPGVTWWGVLAGIVGMTILGVLILRKRYTSLRLSNATGEQENTRHIPRLKNEVKHANTSRSGELSMTGLPRASAHKQNREMLRFCIAFLLYVSVFATAFLKFQHSNVLEPLLGLNTTIVSSVLNLLGSRNYTEGARVISEAFSFEVTPGCTSIIPTGLFVSLIMAWPCQFRDKATGIAVTSVALFGINLLRLVTLYYVGAVFPGFLDTAHVYVWQFLMYAAGTALLLLWIPVRAGNSLT